MRCTVAIFLEFFCSVFTAARVISNSSNLTDAPQRLELYQSSVNIAPPHCTKSSIVRAESSRAMTGSSSKTGPEMDIRIGLQNTVCFRLQGNAEIPSVFSDVEPWMLNQGWLHTLTLSQLEHHHPVSQNYVFAIPEVETNCICECNIISDVCSARTHSFTSCSNSNVFACYRTYHPSQSDAGCEQGAQSKLCCEVKFKPYKNESFMAVKVEQPTTFAVFKYAAYDYSAGRWIEKDKSTFRVEIDGHTQSLYLDRWRAIRINVAAGGRASHNLDSGMYFASYNPGGEMDDLRMQPINEINENNFDRLGWFRKDNYGRFFVHNGKVRVQKMHSVKVENCKEQVFQSYFDANHYLDQNGLQKGNSFDLGRPVEQIYPWIRSARLIDSSARQVIVSHAEGTNLQISLQMPGINVNTSFLHDFSRVADFSGTIIIDFKSNRYLNMTVINSTGILHGTIKKTVERNSVNEFVFTTYINDLESTSKTMIIPLPIMVHKGSRLICLRADDNPTETEVCRVVTFKEEPLEINLLENTWKELGGYCPECNKISINGFLSNLNPLNWANGAKSLSNFIMMISDIVLYFIALVFAYFCITRCVLPLLRCGMCSTNFFFSCLKASKQEKKSNQKQYSQYDHYSQRAFYGFQR